MVSPELFTVDDDEFDEMADRFESRYNLDPMMDVPDIETRLLAVGDLPAAFPYKDFSSRYHWVRANEAVASQYGSQPEHDYRIAASYFEHFVSEMKRLAKRVDYHRDEATAAMFLMQYVDAMKQAHLWRLCLENISGRRIEPPHVEVRREFVSRAAVERARVRPPEEFADLDKIPVEIPPEPEPEEREEEPEEEPEETPEAKAREAAERFYEEQQKELEERRRISPMDEIEEMIRRDRERLRRATEEEE